MRARTLFFSVALHGAVVAAAALVAKRSGWHAPVDVELVFAPATKTAAPPPAPSPSPSPSPAPAPAPARPRAPAPARAHAPVANAAPTPAADAPLALGLVFGNDDGPGVDVPVGLPMPESDQPIAPRVAAAAAPPPVRRALVASAPCAETSSKPVAVARTAAIGYTPEARAARVEGRLVLRVVVGADGAVKDVVVTQPVHPSLDAAAVAAVRTWRFRPATRCGLPVDGGTYVVARRFELGD